VLQNGTVLTGLCQSGVSGGRSCGCGWPPRSQDVPAGRSAGQDYLVWKGECYAIL